MFTKTQIAPRLRHTAVHNGADGQQDPRPSDSSVFNLLALVASGRAPSNMPRGLGIRYGHSAWAPERDDRGTAARDVQRPMRRDAVRRN